MSCPKIRKRIPQVTSRLECNCQFDGSGDHYPTPLLHRPNAAKEASGDGFFAGPEAPPRDSAPDTAAPARSPAEDRLAALTDQIRALETEAAMLRSTLRREPSRE